MDRRNRNPGREADDLSKFSKNRFFAGKLMTPKIMQNAREYQNERLQTVTRYVGGTGVVNGLTIQSVKQAPDGLEVTIKPGLAIDGIGRPVVVEQVTTKTLPEITADTVYLYIQYDEVPVGSVPVPETDGAVDADSVPNRLVESFELTYRETAPDDPGRAEALDLQDVLSEETDGRSLGQRVAERYHRTVRSSQTATTDSAVYLGGLEQSPDGSWAPMSSAPPRDYVYDNDMLFTLLAKHFDDTENPHETPVHEPIDPQPDDIEATNARLSEVEAQIDRLESERDSFIEYAVRKSVKDRSRFFSRLSDQLEEPNGDASLLAREIARSSTDGFIDGTTVEGRYREQLLKVLDHLIELGDELEGSVPEESLKQYLRAVSDLQSTVESEAELLELMKADSRVSETADSIDVLVDVVPDT